MDRTPVRFWVHPALWASERGTKRKERNKKEDSGKLTVQEKTFLFFLWKTIWIYFRSDRALGSYIMNHGVIDKPRILFNSALWKNSLALLSLSSKSPHKPRPVLKTFGGKYFLQWLDTAPTICLALTCFISSPAPGKIISSRFNKTISQFKTTSPIAVNDGLSSGWIEIFWSQVFFLITVDQ